MKATGLLYFTDIHLTVVGLMIFFLFFLGVIWWTSKKQNQLLYNRIKNLPLENGEFYE